MKRKGFTLAEILITLAIIGVVATLTIPGTIKNYRNKVLMTQLQNTVNLVKTSIATAMDDNAAESLEDLASWPNQIEDFMTKYFDAVNVGGLSNYMSGGYEHLYDTFLAESYSSFDKTTTYDARSGFVEKSEEAFAGPGTCISIPAGASICLTGLGYGKEGDSIHQLFLIDVNGQEGPNTNGKDLFAFWASGDGKLHFTFSDNPTNETNGTTCTTSSADPFTSACLAYIISHGWTFKF